jgi:hypothetical protein
MMTREISLSGGEITIIKALGLDGSSIHGRQLQERLGEMESAELLDDLTGLIMLGYVIADKSSFRTAEDVEEGVFHVNPNYARDLRDSISPNRRQEPKRRRRRRG